MHACRSTLEDPTIWQRLPKAMGAAGKSIIVARYPITGQDGRVDEDAEREMAIVQATVEGARTIRAERDQPFAVKLDLALWSEDAASASVWEAQRDLIARLTNATVHTGDVSALLSAEGKHWARFVRGALHGALDIPLDLAKEEARLTRELAKVEKDLAVLEKKLSNPGFTERAPADVVAADKKRKEELATKGEQLRLELDKLR